MAASVSHAPEPHAPATIAFLCPGCSNRLTVPISLAGVTGPCPHCATVIQSPAAPAAQTESAPIAPAVRSSSSAAVERPSGIQPRGNIRPPQINIRSVSSIDWASDDAREASRRVSSGVSAVERIDHRIESISKSNRFENFRAICSIAAVTIMAGTMFFMAKTGWGNEDPPTAQSIVEPATTTSQYVSATSVPDQSPETYPWREPLPEVKRDKDDPFYSE